MGWDINLHVEVKTERGWELLHSPKIERSYALFSKLADVENFNYDVPIKAISKPKGLPEDVSSLVKLLYKWWGKRAHFASYILEDEIKELKRWLKEYHPLGYSHLESEILGLNAFISDKCLDDGINKEISKDILDVRFVFWFDN